MSWRDQIVGWANVKVDDGALDVQAGFVSGKAPAGAAFRRAFEDEVERLRLFLGPAAVSSVAPRSARARGSAG